LSTKLAVLVVDLKYCDSVNLRSCWQRHAQRNRYQRDAPKMGMGRGATGRSRGCLDALFAAPSRTGVHLGDSAGKRAEVPMWRSSGLWSRSGLSREGARREQVALERVSGLPPRGEPVAGRSRLDAAPAMRLDSVKGSYSAFALNR